MYYFIAKFRKKVLTLFQKKPFMVYKVFQMIIEMPMNIECLMFFSSSNALSFSLNFESLDRPTATRTGKGKSNYDPNFLSSTGV